MPEASKTSLELVTDRKVWLLFDYAEHDLWVGIRVYLIVVHKVMQLFYDK
jgi:hypothetical protein